MKRDRFIATGAYLSHGAEWLSAENIGVSPRVVEISAVFVNRRPNGAPRLVLYFVEPRVKVEVEPCDNPVLFNALGAILTEWIGAKVQIKMTRMPGQFKPPVYGKFVLTNGHELLYGAFRVSPVNEDAPQ